MKTKDKKNAMKQTEEHKHTGGQVELTEDKNVVRQANSMDEPEKKRFTVIIFSENTVGLLNQITIIFTRRQLNIETLSVSPSAIEGIHKFTITTFADEVMMKKVVRQIDKRVDVLKAYFNTDEEIVHQEIALYKLNTELFIRMDKVEDLIRKYNVRVIDINDTSLVLEKSGHYAETQTLFQELSERIGVLQFIRSGRIAITKSKVERLSDMLSAMSNRINQK